MTKRVRRAAVAAIALGAIILQSGVAYAQAKNTPAKSAESTIRGCVQSAQESGYVLLNPQGSPAANKTQTLTYRLESSAQGVDFSKFANKRVEVTGTLSAKAEGNVPAAVPDSVRGTGGAGGSGKPGVDNASTYVNGTFQVKTIKQVSGTCAGDARK